MFNKTFQKIIFFSIFANQLNAFKIFKKEINPKLIFKTTLFFGSVGFAFKKFKDEKRKIESLEKELSILNLDINKKNLNINIIEEILLKNELNNLFIKLDETKKYLEEKDYEILNLKKSLNTEINKNMNNKVELNSRKDTIEKLKSEIKRLEEILNNSKDFKLFFGENLDLAKEFNELKIINFQTKISNKYYFNESIFFKNFSDSLKKLIESSSESFDFQHFNDLTKSSFDFTTPKELFLDESSSNIKVSLKEKDEKKDLISVKEIEKIEISLSFFPEVYENNYKEKLEFINSNQEKLKFLQEDLLNSVIKNFFIKIENNELIKIFTRNFIKTNEQTISFYIKNNFKHENINYLANKKNNDNPKLLNKIYNFEEDDLKNEDFFIVNICEDFKNFFEEEKNYLDILKHIISSLEEINKIKNSIDTLKLNKFNFEVFKPSLKKKIEECFKNSLTCKGESEFSEFSKFSFTINIDPSEILEVNN